MTVRYKKVSEATIQKQIAEDPDDFEAQPGVKARPFAEVLPELAANMRKNLGGRPKSNNPKVAVNIRLNAETVKKFKATGKGWQSRISDILDAAKV
jgi:uncharacterized protein (DUF4415 family)